MPTGEKLLEDKEWAESQGYSVALLDKDLARGDWYRPDGKCILGLPVDPYHREVYRKKGWSLRQPTPEQIEAWKQENPAAWARLQPAMDTITPVAALPPELQKELAEVTGTALPKPPKHVHVYQEAIGSPCLVMGCVSARRTARVSWTPTNKKVKEG